MPKKKIHRRSVVKKVAAKVEPQENQEEVVADSATETGNNPQETTPPDTNIPTQTGSVVNQIPDVGSQASSMPSAPQSMPQTESLAGLGSMPVDSPQAQPTGENNIREDKSEDTVSAEDSSENESEANEPIVVRNESGGGRGIFKILLTIIKYLFIFALGVVIGGFVMYQKGNIDFLKKVVQKEDTSKKTEIISTPTPTEIPIDLTKYSIKVLNGSEIEGEASKLKSSLEEEGFKVSSVGNATESSFLKTVISAKTEVDKAYLEKLKTFLLKTYKLSDVKELKDSADDDVEIIIGVEPE